MTDTATEPGRGIRFIRRIASINWLPVKHTALVRIDTDVPDPSHTLIHDIGTAIGTDEVDIVAGPFDLLACIVDNNEAKIGEKILSIRRIKGVKRTMSLRVFDYVSTSPNAPRGNRVQPA